MARTITVKGVGNATIKPVKPGVSWQIPQKPYNIDKANFVEDNTYL